ncbi:hypothetical protein [Vibrio campbellii]|uniref:hypothetical protein n=1 Tax=Vibrio campbellii TaxID=680 RepID=UPI0005EF595A|nr:hypothetical protein [Vibrio campbellii]
MADLKKESLYVVGILLVLLCLPIAAIEKLDITSFSFIPFIEELGILWALSAVSILVSNMFNREWKFRLIYFSKRKSAYKVKEYCKDDSRIDLEDAINKWPEIFSKNRNMEKIESRWYKDIYFPVRDSKVMRSANRVFLISRDVYISWIVFTLFVLTSDMFQIYNFQDYSLRYLLLIVILLNFVARNTGRNLVVNSVTEALN